MVHLNLHVFLQAELAGNILMQNKGKMFIVFPLVAMK